MLQFSVVFLKAYHQFLLLFQFFLEHCVLNRQFGHGCVVRLFFCVCLFQVSSIYSQAGVQMEVLVALFRILWVDCL